MKNAMLIKLWLKVRSSVRYFFVDPAKASATCSNKNSLKSRIPSLVYIIMGNGHKALLAQYSPRFTMSQVIGWVLLLPTLVGFSSTAFPQPRPLPRPCARPLPPPTPLPTDLLAQRTSPPRPRRSPCLQTPQTSPPSSAPPKTHTWTP